MRVRGERRPTTAGHTRRRRIVSIVTLSALVGGPAALALAPPASAATFNIACGDVAGLKNAINQANATPTTPSTINLAARCPYVLATPVSATNDGLPPVASPITLKGNGSAIA